MSRHVAFRRQPVDPQVAQRHQAMTIPAPTRGLIESENLAYMQPGGAMQVDNWFPTIRGLRLRGGCTRWCDLHEGLDDDDDAREPVISAFEYVDGNNHRMFAGQPTDLWDVTTDTPVLVQSGMLSGNYAAAQLSNAGGRWMLVVNDAGDGPLRFDGTTWVTLAAGDLTGPGGIPRAKLVYVWKYRNRLFYIEQSSMNAWYSGIDEHEGELNIIPLSGAATKGGKLLFGATWSIDAGDGIDDKCVMVTDLGEILVFTGSNPGDAASWRQEGRYQIAPPLGMNAWINLGGDLLIATVEGIVPVSKAITKSATELQLAAISYPINRSWREQVLEKREYHWSMEKWDEQGGLFVATPGSKTNKRHAFAANSVSLAWCRIWGWDVWCWIRMRGDMFFGTGNGLIMQADRTGYDDGRPYVATLVGGWGTFQQQAQTSVWHQARASFSSAAAQPFQPQLSACVDFLIKLPTPPAAGPDPGVLDVWDQGLWGPDMSHHNAPAWQNATLYNTVGTMICDITRHTYWDVAVSHTSAASGTFAADREANPTYWTLSDPQPPTPTPTPEERELYSQWDQAAPGVPPIRNTRWVSIGRTGYTHAPIVQVQVAQQAKPDVELIAIDCTFERLGVNV